MGEDHHIGVDTSSLRLDEDVVAVPLDMDLSRAQCDVFYRLGNLDNRYMVKCRRYNLNFGLGVERSGRQERRREEGDAVKRRTYGRYTVAHSPHRRPKDNSRGMPR